MASPVLRRPEHTPPLRSLGELLAISLSDRRPLRASFFDFRGEHEIYFDQGQVMHARYGELEGSAAVVHMIAHPAHRFRIELGRAAPRRSVVVSWAWLCNDARRHTEATHSSVDG
ncbi:MAG: DUF4388 domain-containing protein [Deltaproteobacteria bacterium]|nr:DUF4388 domain-containing protein [Nannocystaceae bacterium]